MSETGYIRELEDDLAKANWKADFYGKHFKHLVYHYEYNPGDYCPRVMTGFSSGYEALLVLQALILYI